MFTNARLESRLVAWLVDLTTNQHLVLPMQIELTTCEANIAGGGSNIGGNSIAAAGIW